MATLEVLLLAFFLIFLVLILVRMDRGYRQRIKNETDETLSRIINERNHKEESRHEPC